MKTKPTKWINKCRQKQLYEDKPTKTKPTMWIVHANGRLGPACKSTQSDQILQSTLNWELRTYVFIIHSWDWDQTGHQHNDIRFFTLSLISSKELMISPCPGKTQIRLGKCQVLSESLLASHIILLIWSCAGNLEQIFEEGCKSKKFFFFYASITVTVNAFNNVYNRKERNKLNSHLG